MKQVMIAMAIVTICLQSVAVAADSVEVRVDSIKLHRPAEFSSDTTTVVVEMGQRHLWVSTNGRDHTIMVDGHSFAIPVERSVLVKPKPTMTDSYDNHEPSESRPASTSVQCSGTTKKGNRCKRMTTSANGRCYQH